MASIADMSQLNPYNQKVPELLKQRLDQIVKAYDIRGTCPDQLDADVANALGAGFARFVRSSEPDTSAIVVGRDMRPSGPELVEAFSSAVLGHGLDVIDVGMASTDLLYFASGSLRVPGAMFTASHNPAQYNGVKLSLSEAAPIGADSGLETIKRLAVEAAASQTVGSSGRSQGTRSERAMLDDFSAHVRSFVDLTDARPLKVVADTANGMGGLVVPAVFKHLPFELEVMYAELDGTFPNHEANPIDVENLVDLQSRVLETGADIGLAFDGDADRVFLVDEQARPVSGSLTTALLAKSLLDVNPGASIIHNLICSKVVPEVIKENGGTPIRSRVGHSFIKAEMASTGAEFGGEHSAHYYFKNNWRADSGLIAAVLVLEQLARSGGTLSQLLAPFDRYAASGEINTTVDDTAAVIDKVAVHFEAEGAKADWLDGLTIDHGDWWFNLRPSNTEPLLRLNLEAGDQHEVLRRVSEVQAAMAVGS